MNRIFSIAIFLLLLSTICWAGGKKQKTDAKLTTQTQQKAPPPPAPQPEQPRTPPPPPPPPPPPASPFWTGDGGKGISLAILAPKTSGLADNQSYLPSLIQGEFVSNFTGYSAISVLDRQRLDDQYAELLSGYYDEKAKEGLDLGKLTPTSHIMGGTLTRTATGYQLQIQITKTDDKITTASHSATFTFADLDNLSGIRRTSLALLEKMGVIPTAETREELTRAAETNHVNAQTALARGVSAKTEVEALSYYFQAAAFDPSLLEATSRSSILNANINSGNIGDNVRNDIQWRRDWVKRLTETEQYFDSLNRTSPMPYTLFYTNEIEQGKIDYEKETVSLSVNTNLHGSRIWAAAVEKALQTVYDGLDATKRKGDWGLAEWPWKGVTNLNSFARRSKDFSVVAELLNNRKEIIGRQTIQTSGSWEYSQSRDRDNNRISRPKVTVSEDDRKTISFQNVDANKITDNLTIRFISVNGTNAETAARNGVLQITALPGEVWDFYYNLEIRDGVITKYSGKGGAIVIDNIWGEPITVSIGAEVFKGKRLTSVIIGNNVTSIGSNAFANNPLLTSVIIGNNVTSIGNSAFVENQLTSVIIPNRVRSIGTFAFPGSKLTIITIGANVALAGKGWTGIHVFYNDFDDFYEKNGKRAGTYIYNDRRWSYYSP